MLFFIQPSVVFVRVFLSSKIYTGANQITLGWEDWLNIRFIANAVRCAVLLMGLVGCGGSNFVADDYLYLGDVYDVTIRRDIRGVPHVLGDANTDAAFGLGYAQAEDNWQLIEEAIPVYRGNSALFVGQDGAASDYLVHWLGLWETLDQNYRWDLSPQMREYVEAYADGLNFYAATHPDAIDATVLPITGQDVVAGFMVRHLLFYGFQNTVQELLEDTRQRPISGVIRQTESKLPSLEPRVEPPEVLNQPPPDIMMMGVPIGSNAFAIAPRVSDEGMTRLAINSHQPTTGPVAWYEAHIKSAEGLNVMGGLFPGSPVIHVGFTENLAWGATVNNPDLVDVFVLDINPDNENQYRLDGQWRDLEVKEIELELRLWGLLPWTVNRESLRSVHGPVLRTDHGTYALRYAGMGELRQVEQWYRMNLAQDFLDWKEAMRMMSFASFNFVYADKLGNIMYLHNSLTPKRDIRYDWQQYLPGDDSSLIWKEHLGFSQLPQVVNPDSGYVLSANQTPFNVTAGDDNPKEGAFAPEHGFQQDMTNRAQRGLELFQQYGPTISAEEFFAIKHDKFYSPNTHYVAHIQRVVDQDVTDPALVQAQGVLAEWDLGTDLENTGAALGTCFLRAAVEAKDLAADDSDSFLSLLKTCAENLRDAFGELDPEWGLVNRHVRGEVNLPIAGGPDILRAVYGSGLAEDGFLTNMAGDGLYYLVAWNANGQLSAQGVHQYGSATLDPTSPHYADQAEDFVKEVLHSPLFEEAALQDKLLSAYRPGEELSN
jgi:penicillin amidase/acyl-homoserine-lactone acylase